MNKINVRVEPTKKNGEWRVVEPFSFMGINVKKGQLTDGASIPWILRWLLRVGGRLFAPSVIHDTGYRNGLLTRKRVDYIYYKAMCANNVPTWKRSIIYKGVLLFGKFSYKGNDKY